MGLSWLKPPASGKFRNGENFSHTPIFQTLSVQGHPVALGASNGPCTGSGAAGVARVGDLI